MLGFLQNRFTKPAEIVVPKDELLGFTSGAGEPKPRLMSVAEADRRHAIRSGYQSDVTGSGMLSSHSVDNFVGVREKR